MNASIRSPRSVALVAMLAGLILLPSCTAMSRGLGKLTANKYAAPQSGSVWVVPPPQLEPPAPANKTVYISYRNISDAEIDLTDLLRDTATQQNWTIVADPTQAKYRLRAQTRFFGEVEPDSGGRRQAETMGWISGAAVGVGTGVLVANATDSNLGGAAAGIAAGGMVGMGMSNASTPREWAMIVDFVLEEYNETPVEFELLSDSSSTGSSGAGVGNSHMAEGSDNKSGNSKSGSMNQSSNYFPHGVRLSVWANQMNMKEAEAMPLIVERASKVVTQMLPI